MIFMASLKTKFFKSTSLCVSLLLGHAAWAHYPFVAPLAYQTFNNHAAIISGFYDNPFASEVAIKNFDFHYHKPSGEKVAINEDLWSKTQTLSSYSLETKEDGTYRIRGEKQGNHSTYALVGKQWKPVIAASKKSVNVQNDKVVHISDLNKNSAQKTVQNIELIETFISRRNISNQVIDHIHSGFDVQFLTHPNQMKVNQTLSLVFLDDKKGIVDLKVEILAPTSDFGREENVYSALKTDAQGNLKFTMSEKGQYLLKVDYQQPFSNRADDLKRYKYTLAFNVID